MNMPRHPPVDADDAHGRRVAGAARAAVFVGLVAVLAGSVVLIDRPDARQHSAELSPHLADHVAIEPVAAPAPAPAAMQPLLASRSDEPSQEVPVAHGD